MNQNTTVNLQTVDLTNCDREPIHIPGSIQSHGVLLALEESSFKIVQVSSNTFEFLGLHPQELLGKELQQIFNLDQISAIARCLSADFETVNPLKISFDRQEQKLFFNGIVHRSQEIIILELEPTNIQQETNFISFQNLVKTPLTRFQNAANLAELCQIIVKEIRRVSGFERVMVYQLDPQGAGTIVAEDKPEEVISYLGLHYPTSDIPQQAKQLYLLQKLRLIPDINYQPSPLVPLHNPITDRPLDLSLSVLRSVSPVHIEYLHNMGVTATMTISLIENNRLWGMIACHHSSPKYVNYETRTICEFLAQVMSLELKAKEESQDLDYKKKLQSIQSQLVASISDLEDFQDCFVEENNNLLELVGASGAAICWQEEINAIGKTPDRSQILALLDWIDVKIKDDLIFDTDSLPKKYAAAEQFKDTASGLLVLAIAKFPRNYILWFRPEVIQTVNWGGNPNNPVEIEENGELKLSPRKSFALWQETVQLQSLPWKQWEIEAALELRSNIVNIIFRQADRLAKLNLELERSNNELDAFAYIASHDLKEPLRGIHNYSSFLIEDYADLMSGDGITKLQTLMDLTQRMEDLINSLLHYSRLGRTELKKQETDLNELLKNAIDTLSISAKVDAIEIEIPRPLPRMKCDRVLMREVFTNLITNAIKYNNKPQKWVEIGWQQLNNQIIFYVKDNGIGIRDKHQERIFAIFKRLHPTSKYGGGTGAGLTIVKKILERHDGRIWLESTYGEGSTFYFTWSN